MLDMGVLAEEIAAIVSEEVARGLAPLQQENTALKARINALEKRAPEKGEPGEAGRDGSDGKDGADGRDGKDGVDGKDGIGLPGEKGADGKDGADGRDGKDGAGIADLMIDRDHCLVATFSDGRIKSLGRIVGADGKDGADGRDGADGLGPEDLGFQYDGVRTLSFVFQRGDVAKSFDVSLPIVIDRGVYREGQSYAKGDAVTWGGSLWIAQDDTSAKPDAGGWRLAVKRGRDGKDAGK